MSKKSKNNSTSNSRKFIYVVTCDAEYDKTFAFEEKAKEYCNQQDDIYDLGSWNIISVPIKDTISPIY